jgi:hypothetical protein
VDDSRNPSSPLVPSAPNGFRLVRMRVLERTGRVVDRCCLACRRCYRRIDIGASLVGRTTHQDMLDAAGAHRCPDPFCEWDAWKGAAIAEGLEPDLVFLGCRLMRVHRLVGSITSLEGEQMIEDGLKAPDVSRHRWANLLDALQNVSPSGGQ